MTSIIIMATLIIIAFLAIVVVAIKIAIKKEKDVYSYGIEVDSVVVNCERYFSEDNTSRHHCYVKYVGDDGIEHKGLLNTRTTLPVGRKVRVRYIPGKYDEVVFVSQEIE